jgi:hypothetical protein
MFLEITAGGAATNGSPDPLASPAQGPAAGAAPPRTPGSALE